MATTVPVIVPITPGTGIGPYPTSQNLVAGTTGHGFQASGPWFIESQSLGYNYHRVPIGEVSSMFLGLSSVDINPMIGQTVMVCEAWAFLDGVSAIDWYECSGISGGVVSGCEYQQGQRFALDVMQEVDGIAYGASTPGCFGPGGNCYSASAYYGRRLLKDGDFDYHYDITHAYNFSAIMLEDMGDCQYFSDTPTAGTAGVNSGQELKERFFTIHTTLGLGSGRVFCKNWTYDVWPALRNQKPQGYSRAQDRREDVQLFTDGLGKHIQNGLMVGATGVHLPAIPYDIFKHSWQ